MQMVLQAGVLRGKLKIKTQSKKKPVKGSRYSIIAIYVTASVLLLGIIAAGIIIWHVKKAESIAFNRDHFEHAVRKGEKAPGFLPYFLTDEEGIRRLKKIAESSDMLGFDKEHGLVIHVCSYPGSQIITVEGKGLNGKKSGSIEAVHGIASVFIEKLDINGGMVHIRFRTSKDPDFAALEEKPVLPAGKEFSVSVTVDDFIADVLDDQMLGDIWEEAEVISQ